MQSALDHAADKITHAWIDNQRRDKRLQQLTQLLTRHNIPIETTDRKLLDKLADGQTQHQGIVVAMEMPSERSESELKQDLPAFAGLPLLLVLDQVQDPHNLGACLRTADAVGAHGIIVPKDNASGITPAVCKVASGAAETVPVYQVTNLARTLRWLKTQQVWIMGSSGSAEQSLFQADLTLPLAIVMGTESKGMRPLTAKHCDFLVRIPMQGRVESLNVSVAAGILLFETLRQREIA